MKPTVVAGTSLLALTALLALVLPSACGGGDPAALTDEGLSALNSGDYDEAVAKLDKALAKLEPGAPGYLEASLGRIRARAHSAPAAARDEFLALAKAQPLGPDAYHGLVDELASTGALSEGVEILTAGKAAHPSDPKWDAKIQKLGDRAKAAGNDDALAALKGLGYVGGD